MLIVDSQYKWQEKIENKQVTQFLNFVATSDWVVAIFSNVFEGYPWNNLGGAGHKGFKMNVPRDNHDDTNFNYQTNPEQTRHQLRYLKGDHGAAIQEENWELIADFVLDGEKALNKKALQEIKTHKIFENKQNLLIATLGLLRHFIMLNLKNLPV